MTATHTVTLQRVLRAPPERIYRAFLDPAAMVKWLPPHGYTAQVHEMDARVGGNTGCPSPISRAGTAMRSAVPPCVRIVVPFA